MYKLAFYVPLEDAEAVKEAVFASGAGRIGDYEACCFETRGTGQFRPLDGANPHIGQVGDLEKVEEVKVELVCEDQLIHDAVAALRAAHPYEEPAFDVWRLEAF
ncbi:YqfO family protein [Billgrantia bachuensis]|uniref:NGG1p interacting factor NIF3 n=1 Tax=Billgrantia bachuensis TaxID=2717286 RepID=A0ABX0PWD1_9GAMM|nr:YqfO family protein [Halomonas bachuensis]NIC07511.1 NGG1p interacting factor NIF3 [Halomonas bachuensis]